MRFPVFRTVAVVLIAALALSACKDDTSKDDAKPSDEASSSKSSPSSSPSAAETEVPKTSGAAIDRYEEYLHAVGKSELDTMCEIAKPAMDTVSGDCKANFRMMLSMFSTEQLKALETATIDTSQVKKRDPGTVDIPASAVQADATFGANDLGDVTLEYQKDNWFIVD